MRSCIPFAVGLVFVLGYKALGISFEIGILLAFIINGIWWLICTSPLLRNYKQKHYKKTSEKKTESLKNVMEVVKQLRSNRPVFFFLISYFFYIDGVFTIIDMATVYGKALGLDSTGLLLALSRSYYAKIIPKDEAGNATQGISALSVIIAIGFIMFRISVREVQKKNDILEIVESYE